MAPERIVFHCTDRDLFDPFIASLPRRVLTDPLRGSAGLKARHFRGYRISKDRPDANAIAVAYYKEINTEQNDKLLHYLCHNWLLVHQVLAQQTLRVLDLEDVDLSTSKSWLRTVHARLLKRGHVEVGREVVRALAFDHHLEDILIAVSILNADTRTKAASAKNWKKSSMPPTMIHRSYIALGLPGKRVEGRTQAPGRRTDARS